MRYILCSYLALPLFLFFNPQPRISVTVEPAIDTSVKLKTYYGIASYYADKFNGRETANGEIYSHEKLTAACNILPLGTWIKVTNLRNNKSVIVKTNDRLHPRMKRIVDLSKLAAKTLGYISRGLTQVKVEVIEKRSAKSRLLDK